MKLPRIVWLGMTIAAGTALAEGFINGIPILIRLATRFA